MVIQQICLLVFMHIYRLGNITQKGPSLWTADDDQLFDDTLLKGVSLLQPFNISDAGGIERVLQIASDLSQRRSRESITQQANPSLRNRFGVNMWRDFTSQRLSSNENPMDAGNGTDSKNSDASAASSNPSLVSQITNTVWKGITNQTAMESSTTPPSPTVSIPPDTPEPEVNPQTTSNLWSYAEKLKGSNTIATLSKMSSNWRARALLSSSGGSLQTTNIVSGEISHRHSNEQDSPRTSSSFSTHSPDLPVETAAEGSSQQSNRSLLEKTRSLLSPRSPPSLSPKSTPKSAPKPLLLSSTLVTSSQGGLKNNRNLINSSTIPDPEEWADVMREKQHYIYRDSLSSTSSVSPSDRYVRTPKSTTSDRESDTSSSRIVSLNRRSVSPMAPSFRSAREHLQSRTSSMSSGFTSPPTLHRSPLQENRKTSARFASTSESSAISQTYSPLSDPNASRTASGPKESDDSDATSNERPPSVIRLTEAEDAELSTQASRVRAKRYPRLPNLSIPDSQKPQTSIEEKNCNSSQLTVEWPQHENEVVSTPRGSRFESEEHVPISRKLSRSPLRKKLSAGELDHQRKVSVDTIRDYRQRKVSSGHRHRKISTESREISKNRRNSSAEEGDDEGYDELLSAYESEDGPRSSLEQ